MRRICATVAALAVLSGLGATSALAVDRLGAQIYPVRSGKLVDAVWYHDDDVVIRCATSSGSPVCARVVETDGAPAVFLGTYVASGEDAAGAPVFEEVYWLADEGRLLRCAAPPEGASTCVLAATFDDDPQPLATFVRQIADVNVSELLWLIDDDGDVHRCQGGAGTKPRCEHVPRADPSAE